LAPFQGWGGGANRICSFLKRKEIIIIHRKKKRCMLAFKGKVDFVYLWKEVEEVSDDISFFVSKGNSAPTLSRDAGRSKYGDCHRS